MNSSSGSSIARSIHAFERIDGSFAIALFDAHSDCLVLAADRWGSQPLYFAAGRAGWTFASEYKALLGDEAPAPALDVAVAAYVLANKHFPAHRTLLSNVQAGARRVRAHPGPTSARPAARRSSLQSMNVSPRRRTRSPCASASSMRRTSR